MKSRVPSGLRQLGWACLLVSLSVWLAPALVQFANCRTWQARQDANEPFVPGIGTNYHVAVTNYRQDSFELVGAKPFGPAGGPYVVYMPLLPARAIGKPLPEDLRLMVKAVVRDPKVDLPRLLQGNMVSGVIRRPALSWTGSIVNEDDLIKNWLAAPRGAWFVLDTTPRRYIRWTDLTLLLPLGLALWSAYRLGCLRMLGWSEKQVLGATLLAAALLTSGVVLILLQPAGPAVWNAALPVLSNALILLGLGSLPAFLAQLLLLKIRNQERQQTEVAAPAAPEDPHAPPFEPTPTGFILRDGTGRHEFLDAAVTAMAMDKSPCLTPSGEQKLLRSVKLKIEDGPRQETFVIRNVLAPGETDPLQPCFSRLIAGMSRRYGALVKSSGELCGPGWTLSACGLMLIKGDNKETYGPKLLNSGEWVGDRYCIWTADKEEPVLSLADHSENVHILAEVLPAVLPSKLLPTKFASGLGRLRAQWKTTEQQRAPWWMAPMGGIFLTVAGFLGLSLPILLGLGALLVLLQLMPLQTHVTELLCFDEGLIVKGSSGERKLKYTELASATWNLNPGTGKSTGKISFRLCPATGDELLVEATSGPAAVVPRAWQELKRLTAEAISMKILETLARTGSTNWTQKISLRLEGFSIDGGAPIPYAAISQMALNDKSQALELAWKSGGIQVPVTEPNFDAGWQVFQLIRQTLSESPASPAQPQPVVTT